MEYFQQNRGQRCRTPRVIQGPAIEPASYVINASYLDVLTTGNELCKFADDAYLFIQGMNIESRSAEMDHIETCTLKNNLTLNKKKSTEFVLLTLNLRRKRPVAPPISANTRYSRHHFDKGLGVTMVCQRQIMSLGSSLTAHRPFTR